MTRILVVDDHAPNREYLVSLLGYGYTVSEAADGADALEQARRARPDLVIADILMPAMDGYEFVRRLRGEPGISDVPVIFYTAVYHEHETRELAESCGVTHVLIKPSEPEVVLQTVTEALEDKAAPLPPPPDEEEFGREHLRVVADKLSQTIEQLGITNERFKALVDINLQLASERDPVCLLESVCSTARILVGARHAVLAVGGRGDPEVRHCVIVGMDPDVAGAVKESGLDRGRIGVAYTEQRTVRLTNPDGDPEAVGLPAAHPPVHGLLAAPIVSLKHVYGWICLSERIGSSGFSDEDENLLTILAAQVGRIYENGDLYLEVQESERKFRQITEHINEVFFLVDPELTHTLYISPAYEEIWGSSVKDLYDNPKQWIDMVHPDDRDLASDAMATGRSTGRFDYQFRIIRPDGGLRWIHARGFPVRDAEGSIYRIAGTAEDITERKLAEDRIRRLNRLYAVLSGINSTIVRIRDRQALFGEACRILTEQGRFDMAWIGILNGASFQVTPVEWRGPATDYELASSVHFSADEAVPGGRTSVGRAIRERRPVATIDLADEPDPQSIFAELARRGYRRIISLPLASGDACEGVVVLYSREPGQFDDEEMALLVELAGDIAFALDYIRNEERIKHLAYYEPLTGLANRAMLHNRLSEAIRDAGPLRQPFALILLNINNFRDINNTLGHHNGDLLLQEIAVRIERSLWESDMVACLGGDEFAMLLPKLADKDDVEQVVERITGVLRETFVVQDLPINVEARLGVALYPDHGDSAHVLWQRADIALRASKERHRQSSVYGPDVDHYDPGQLALVGGLRAAMDNNELVLHYQPWIDLRTGRACGVEALLRWQHPERGLIFPDEFIPLAERTSLIDELTLWVLENAMRQGHLWHDTGLPLDVAVNISVRNLQESDLCSKVLDLTRTSRLRLEQLRLEITESAIMTDPEHAREVLAELNEAGVQLSVDDFGTGQSSLAYVGTLPVSTIKIDKSFVMNFEQPRNAAIVSAAIDLGHKLGLAVTAEGVEDEATWKALRELGCDLAQGYFFSKPIPVDQLTAWLHDSRWKCVPD